MVLLVVALLPRVWAPDLVPYGAPQAAYVVEASQRASDAWWTAYGDPGIPPLALLDPWLRGLPVPVALWAVLRGMLDALGVALLYLAARSLVGTPGGALAGLLLAATPAVWAAARDPAGPFGPLLMAAGLLAAVRLVARPTVLRGALFGIVLGLLVRSAPPGWGYVLAGAATLALARAFWQVGGAAALGLTLSAGPALWHRWPEIDLARALDARMLQAPGLLFLGPVDRTMALSPASGAATLVPGLTWVAAILVLGLAAAGLMTSVVAAWRGRLALLVAPAWAALSLGWLLAAPGAASTAAAPALCLLVSVALLVPCPAARWVARALVVGVLLIGSLTIGWSIAETEQAARLGPTLQPAGPGAARVAGADLAWVRPIQVETTLRDWDAVADAARETAERVGAREVILIDDPAHEAAPLVLSSLLRGQPAVRTLPERIDVLPLVHDLVILVLPGLERPGVLERASSVMAVATGVGADTGARVVTLRPRPAYDWQARERPVSDGRFADGSALVGVLTAPAPDGQLAVRLSWQLPAGIGGDGLGRRARIGLPNAVSPTEPEAPLPAPPSRRDGELVQQSFAATVPAPRPDRSELLVTLLDAAGRPIHTVDGVGSLAVPLGPSPGR